MTSPTRADWYDDPFERFERRYHDGIRWTKQVSSSGVEITDPDPHPPNEAGRGAPGGDTDTARGTRGAGLVGGVRPEPDGGRDASWRSSRSGAAR